VSPPDGTLEYQDRDNSARRLVAGKLCLALFTCSVSLVRLILGLLFRKACLLRAMLVYLLGIHKERI